jgi:hypothetical protein
MMVRLRWVRKERQIKRDITEAVAVWKGAEGMQVITCQPNGTKAAKKTFRLLKDNIFTWNAGMFVEMKTGVQFSKDTLVSSCGMSVFLCVYQYQCIPPI